MKLIDQLANSIAQRIEDAGKQISLLLMMMNAVIARMNSTSDNYRRIAVVFDAPFVWNNGIIVPQVFEQHQKSRRFYDNLSIATFLLSLIFAIVGCYFAITDDLYYLCLVFVIVIIVALLWHYVIRSASYRVFKLVPEKSDESRVRWAEIVAVVCAGVSFIGALIFTIGRATGDEAGLLTDYFIESLFVADALSLTASGIAHSIADYYRWSEQHTRSYEKDRQELFRLNEQVSKQAALLSRDLKELNRIEESSRPPIMLSAEVVEVMQNYDNKLNDNSTGANPSNIAQSKAAPQLPDDRREN